ncbi:hypothetical protein B0J13DRAFT_46446 [Dactylonectria estremocensis]|uniref:F-box domain-containing protein n=1 Tax=Dactylonectria estremocensis TaxID=1079267 RepID=A0A9P9EUE3_9HYPO|nr:hypothetical protein B0J13DRAFT_46446 [Dactylonectria estremocensis]
MSPPRIARNLIPELTCPREFGLRGMIRDLAPAKSSTISRATASSLGQLDPLPAELLLITLGLLDFQSLSRILRASLRGKELVEALPAYKDMMEHAPETLTALGRTGLLKHHSALLLHQTLQSDKCVSCFNFGGFLFLPTCERVSADCLYENIALRMTTPTIAKQCFGLTGKQLQRIPVMYSIPNTYEMWLQISRKRVYRLVSVKHVKQLAIEIHGSAENVAKLMPNAPTANMTERQIAIFKQFHEASLEPPGCDLSRLPRDEEAIGDDYCAMASIRFPFLKGAGVDNGRVCRGCLFAAELHAREEIPEMSIQEIVPPGVTSDRSYIGLIRLRLEEDFFEHIQTCRGVDLVLQME